MKWLLAAINVLCLCGCARLSVVKTYPNGTSTTFHGIAFFSNTAFRGLYLDEQGKYGTNTLAVTQATNTPNPEAITASAEALGNLIGVAAAAAAKTAVK